MSTRSYDGYLADFRRNFADYTLAFTGAEPARIAHLRKPGHGYMEGVDIVFLSKPDRIIVTGDLAPNDNQGCVSNTGYGIGWFAGKKSEHYLCEKFFREVFVPEKALAALEAEKMPRIGDALTGLELRRLAKLGPWKPRGREAEDGFLRTWERDDKGLVKIALRVTRTEAGVWEVELFDPWVNAVTCLDIATGFEIAQEACNAGDKLLDERFGGRITEERTADHG